MNKLLFASVISEIQQSDIFMTVKARICEAPAANLNGARVTEAFIDEVICNKQQYVGLPLYADVRALVNGNYRRLGHLYDSRTGEFHSTQIGSFYDFEKESLKDGCALVGYARIAKRNKKLSNAIAELFTDGALKFSFEVAVGEYEELDDGTILIDASDSNYLEGTAIVTFPACEDAVALELVAQHEAEQSAEADDTEGGEKEMADIKELVAEEAAEQSVVAEENSEPEKQIAAEVSEEIDENAACEDKENAACKDKEKAEEETEETASAESEVSPEVENAEQQNAAVVIDETHKEKNEVFAYDTETGVSVRQEVKVETSVSHVEPDAQIVQADDGIHIAEEADSGEESGQVSDVTGDTSVEEPVVEQPLAEENPEDVADDQIPDSLESKKKTAEQLIAELAEVVENLKKDIAELKETRVNAETKTVTAEINPFVSNINNEGGYSLLQKETKRTGAYSLLEKY